MLIILSWAGHTQGNVRDEGYYFDAAEQYYGWYGELGENLISGHPLKSFTRSNIDRWFGYNHEHPALMKTLFGFSWRIFHKCRLPRSRAGAIRSAMPRCTARWRSSTRNRRCACPPTFSCALMAAVLYLWGAAAWSRAAGLVAAILGVIAPRLFFDAQLATFDAPIAALWVFVVYAYWRALSDPRWGWRTGVIFGLALATKHNAFFIPFVLVVHFACVAFAAKAASRLRGYSAGWRSWASPVYLACWPWLWFDRRWRASANMSRFTSITFITIWSISARTITSRPFRSRFPMS